MIETLILAIGLVLIAEGLAWLLAPSLLEQMLEALRSLPMEARRQVGALAFVLGFILLWIAKYMGA